MSNDEKRQARQLIDTAIEKQPETPKKGCRCGCYRSCLVVFIIGLLSLIPLWWIGCHTTPLRVSHDTTRALGPMTPDGKRLDYFRAYEDKYYPPQMQTDENGYRIFIRGVGDLIKRKTWNSKTGEEGELDEKTQESLRRQVYEKLGLDPDVPPTLVSSMDDIPFSKITDAETKKHNEENPEAQIDTNAIYRKIMDSPWTLEEYPFMEDWLKRNDPVLDLLGEAVRKPAFRYPLVRATENASPVEWIFPGTEGQLFRELARATGARIQYRLGTGDIDGAIDDTITLHRLGRHVTRQGMLVNALAGIAIDGIGSAVGIAENPEYPPSKEQIQRLLSELEKLPPFVTVNEILETERYFALASIQDMCMGHSQAFLDDTLLGKLTPTLSWAVDINILMERINKIYDALLDGTLTEDDYQASLNPLSLFTVRGRSTNMANILGALFLPAIQAAREAWRRIECTINMQHLTLALLLYEKDHGHLPEDDWREAVKPYLGANAVKYFQCPTHPNKDCTTYVMVRIPKNTVDVEDSEPTPQQILLVEVLQPQRFGQGDGRLPLEKAKFFSSEVHRQRRPEDFDGIGSYHTGGVNCGFRSGAVHFLSETTPPEKMDAMIRGTATEIP